MVNGFDAKDYTETIEKLIQGGNLEALAQKMWFRVKENYSYSVVKNKLCNTIKYI